MRVARLAIACIGVATASLSLGPSTHAEPITLKAADGAMVFAELQRAATPNAPVILAFHMAGSNHAEYDPIARRLKSEGYSVLALDLRSGGPQFGARNRTVDARGKSATYREALADLEAALDWGKREGNGAPVVVWGSSYSAALVFLLAAAHPGEAAGLLAFSPGEYLGGGDPVHAAARKITVPVFVSQGDGEVDEARSIVAAVASKERTQFVAKSGGVHGSSSLREDANPRGAAEYWTAVLAFLRRFKT